MTDHSFSQYSDLVNVYPFINFPVTAADPGEEYYPAERFRPINALLEMFGMLDCLGCLVGSTKNPLPDKHACTPLIGIRKEDNHLFYKWI